jgi:hypothetical protein
MLDLTEAARTTIALIALVLIGGGAFVGAEAFIAILN